MPVTSATFVRSTIALLLVGLLALIGIVATALWLAGRTETYSESVVDVQQIRRSIFRVVDLVQNAEAGQRGYLLTLEDRYLEPYTTALASMRPDLDTLDALVRGRPQFEARATEIIGLARAKIAELVRTVDLARAGQVDEALAIVRTDTGKALMDRIRATSDALIAATDARLADSANEMRSSATGLNWVLGLGGALILLVVGGSTWVAWRYTRDLQTARSNVEALAASLEERVKERTAELARANEEIQRFAYIVSHDLRAPLVNIMGFTSELETGLQALKPLLGLLPDQDDPANKAARDTLESEMPEAIGFIRSSTGKMDNLINAILKLSREGGRKLTSQRVDMGAIFTKASESLQHQLIESGAEIAVVEPIPDISTDKLAVEQIFGNLLDNAVKYLDPKRPGRIVIRGRQLPLGNIYEVEDNGRGIAAQDHDRIFELFRRAGAQDKAGEGIGLSHVRALVRRLGGDIELQSELGRGTTFRVRLPRSLPLLRESV